MPAMWTGSSAASKSMTQSRSVSPGVAGVCVGGGGLASNVIYMTLGVGDGRFPSTASYRGLQRPVQC